MNNTSNKRLLSLDVLRGLTVAGMILVNNGYGESFEMLRHSRWNGMTPCDLVFPFFLFIMGVSCYISLSKSGFTPTRPVLLKVVKRTMLLFAIGLFINWFDHAIEGDLLCFGHLRLWAVLQRIALCYFFVSLFALCCNHRYTLHTVVGLLAAYTFILLWGNGYAEDASANILAQVDLQLFGYDHLYHKSPVDPEGLVGTISGVAHVLLGFWCGRLLKAPSNLPQAPSNLPQLGEAAPLNPPNWGEVAAQDSAAEVTSKASPSWGRLEGAGLRGAAMGTICLFLGYLLTYGLPLNKRIWSPSYVLVTCGLCALLLVLFIYFIDVRSCKPRYYRWLQVFGMNALALYVGSELLAILFGHLGISDAIYSALHAVIPGLKWASLAYALVFVGINYLIGYLLWKRQIFIKL